MESTAACHLCSVPSVDGGRGCGQRWIERAGAAVSVHGSATMCCVEYVVMVFSQSRRLSCSSVSWSSMGVQVGRQPAS